MNPRAIRQFLIFTALIIAGSEMLATPASAKPTATFMNQNSLFVLRPYRHHGSWVFDDERVGLEREPFVLGIDQMIDRLVADIPEAWKGFRLIFSPQPFPGSATKLEWKREESGGHWYFSPTYQIEGWLCPALLKYFKTAPKELYARAEPLPPGV